MKMIEKLGKKIGITFLFPTLSSCKLPNECKDERRGKYGKAMAGVLTKKKRYSRLVFPS